MQIVLFFYCLNDSIQIFIVLGIPVYYLCVVLPEKKKNSHFTKLSRNITVLVQKMLAVTFTEDIQKLSDA